MRVKPGGGHGFIGIHPRNPYAFAYSDGTPFFPMGDTCYGLFDDSPRSREIVWIMLAQRAARGLGSLYAHANQMTMEEASQVHLQWTPRNWMRREPELLKFEQHLYLRQPGYGTSYVVGKYLIEQFIAQRAKQLESQGKPFVMKEFFKAFNDYGNIPVTLTSKQLLAN